MLQFNTNLSCKEHSRYIFDMQNWWRIRALSLMKLFEDFEISNAPIHPKLVIYKQQPNICYFCYGRKHLWNRILYLFILTIVMKYPYL